VIKKLPKCLHTCLHCKHAVISEVYSACSRKLVYDGCWIHDNLTLPVNRENCEKFEESIDRVQRKFWKKWNWKVYINGDLITLEQPEPEDEESGDLLERDEIHTEQVSGHHTEIYDQSSEQPFKRADEIHEQGTTQGHSGGDQPESSSSSVATPTTTTTDPRKKNKKNTTRVLIQQVLANKISRLKDIAHFADVNPSTAHYHLRNLIREGRVIRTSWGHYAFSDPTFLENSGKTFEKLLKNFSQSIGGKRELHELHLVEKNILMDILSKDNKYEQFSERELARRNSISRYSVKKYIEKLEKSKLIIIKREKNQFVYLPTELAIKGLTDYFQSLNTGSKVDSSSSKIQPPDPGVQPFDPVEPLQNAHDLPEDTSLVPPTGNVLETFDEYIAWQQKNAHRLFIQFKLLHCNHARLKKTGWIFGEKSIRKHFAEAYIFKSKDPQGHFLNVLPKNPIIFFSPFEFKEKIVTLVNEVIDRLREYQIVIDLSEPAEVKMAHVALEDDVFARKVIEKGLLYFKSKLITDATGERTQYVIKIDKSKSLHLEFEGTEAHHIAETYEAFIDDVVSGKIDRKDLRELPHTVNTIRTGIKQEFEKIGNVLSSNVEKISTTQAVLHQNQLEFSQNLVSHTQMVKTISEAAQSVSKAADTIKEVTESLKESLQVLRHGMEFLTRPKDSVDASSKTGGNR
jgi:Mn-dependent DtxR family transcriptional regulator